MTCYWQYLNAVFYTLHIWLSANCHGWQIDCKLESLPSEESDCEVSLCPIQRPRTNCTIFLGYTSNIISSGVREVLRYLVQHNMVCCYSCRVKLLFGNDAIDTECCRMLEGCHKAVLLHHCLGFFYLCSAYKVYRCSSLQCNIATPLWELTCRMGLQCYLPPNIDDISAFTPAEAGTRFRDPKGMQGWVDLGTVVKVHSPCPRLHITVALTINSHPRWHSNLGPLTPLSDTLITRQLRHCKKVCWNRFHFSHIT